jgi:hypothetical protein
MNQSFPTWSFDKACASMEWTGMSGATLTVESANTLADISGDSADLILIGVMAPAKADPTIAICDGTVLQLEARTCESQDVQGG